MLYNVISKSASIGTCMGLVYLKGYDEWANQLCMGSYGGKIKQ